MYAHIVTRLCLTLGDPMDCSPPASSIHEVFQARILEWIAISSSGDLPNPKTVPMSPVFPALQANYLPTKLWGTPPVYCYLNSIWIFLGQNKVTSKSCSSFQLLISHSYKILSHWTKTCQPFLSALHRNNKRCWHPHTVFSVLIGGQLYPKIFPSAS